MRDKMKKIASVALGVLLLGGTASLTACGSGYSPKRLSGVRAEDEVISNGGFVQKKGDYFYFVNGAEDYTAKNTLGKVQKGALYRISESNLEAGNFSKVESVVPTLFVGQDYASGVYIYGDSVYFATPTSQKKKTGAVANSGVSFKKAKLNGSSSEKELDGYLFRLSDNDVRYRFVDVDGTVYCLYVSDSTLYSYNTKKKEKTVLAKGVDGEFYFDETDLENPIVYYAMKVPYGKDLSNKFGYNQLYAVRADQKASVNASKASYTVNGKTYDFDKDYLSKHLDGFKADDYTTYPYVNLGTLILDGRGSSSEKTDFSGASETPAGTSPNGYVYALQRVSGNAVYFTRKDVNTSSSDGENTPLYRLSESVLQSFDAVEGNASLKEYKVANGTTNASASALYLKGDGKIYYFYSSDERIYKAYTDGDGVEHAHAIVNSAESATLYKADDQYLYYLLAGDNGNNVYRVDHTGDPLEYSGIPTSDDYKAQRILDVDVNNAWYGAELIDGYLFYSDAQSFGGTELDYISVVDLNGANGLCTYAELKALNDKQDKVKDFVADLKDDGYETLAKTVEYYYRTGETKVFDSFISQAKKEGYKKNYRYSDYELAVFDALTKHQNLNTYEGYEGVVDMDFTTMFKEDGEFFDTRAYYIGSIGKVKASDQKTIDKSWTTSDYIEALPKLKITESKTGKIVGITLGCTFGALALAAGITVPLVIAKKKKAKKRKERETTEAYKRKKIDTTDDKTINVYQTDDDQKEEKKDE